MTKKEIMARILKERGCQNIYCHGRNYTCFMLITGCSPRKFNYNLIKDMAKNYFTNEELFELML